MSPSKSIKSSLKHNALMVFNGEPNKKLMINYTIITR